MQKQTILIKNKSGLHVRPAGVFVKEVSQYACDVTITFKGNDYNAKSILGVLGAGVKCGDEIELTTSGQDEEQAMAGIAAAIESGLGE